MTTQYTAQPIGTLADLIDRILDKGMVINADIKVIVVGVELLDIRIRAAIASFETAAKYGLEFPTGTKLPEWAGKSKAPAAAVSGNGSGQASVGERLGFTDPAA